MRRLLALGLAAIVGAAIPLTAPRAGVAPVSDQRLGVLAHFYPSERDYAGSNHPMWDRVAALGTDAGLVATVELTTSSVDYMDFVAREQRVGQTVLATVATNATPLMLDSAAFQRTTYGFDGVLLRGYSGTCDGSEPSPSLIAALRSLGYSTVAIQTSGQPGSCYSTLADVLLTFEGTAGAYGAVGMPAWLTGPTPRIWHVVYGVSEAAVAATVASSKAKGADFIMTSPDSGPIESGIVPSSTYLSTLRSAARNGVPSPTPDERWPLIRRPGSVIPAFGAAYPGWSTLHPLPAAPFGVVIINPANGPGATTDAGLAAQVASLKASGRTVLGYLTAGYLPSALRTVDDVVADATRYRSVYAVDGVFVDEVRPECSTAASYATLAARMRAAGVGTIVFNPGRNTGECMVPHFDAIVNFEGPMSSYRTWSPSTWTGRYPASKFWHLVHTTDASELGEVVTLARTRQAGRVYATTLPGAIAWTTTLDPQHLSALATALLGTRTTVGPGPGGGTSRTASPTVSGPVLPPGAPSRPSAPAAA